MNDLDQLYQQVILDHSRERHGHGALTDPDATSHQVNPTCGDDIELGVRVRDGRVVAVGWEGDGCSISQASISVMHDLVDGADLATVARLEKDFDVLMHSRGRGVGDAVLDELEDGAAFEGVSKYPNRVKCALLGWMALKDALVKAGAVPPAGPDRARPDAPESHATSPST
ncbi:SUF system NifU family Fe-S cluster assembly protein [Actinomyces israelii]|uniref:SUF system NifU family Fe-S cluster assembly protein n=1 Tax=Actinomyces israelii TaxID=1659 RepID=A0ABT4I894_9ACTO|nr:SUF system NifU family Fe-S cluster assembly protein [Actinomyces israelii]MCZ0857472.1 SUF system NifU family Fe-S cluster assembly protein [Actinomyces israelii]